MCWVRCCILQEAARLMGRNKSGKPIINLSSIIGDKGKEGQVVYSATKAAILGMTPLRCEGTGAEKHPRECRHAGAFIQTDLLKDLPEQKLTDQPLRASKWGAPDSLQMSPA